MAAKKKPGDARIAELEELIFGEGVPLNLPDFVRELVALDGEAETYARVIMQLGYFDHNADVVLVMDEALRKYPHHVEILAIRKIVEKIEEHEFDTPIRVGSTFKPVNRSLLQERLEQGMWRQCPQCRQIFTTAQILSGDRKAQALGLSEVRADARFCHRNCRSLYNIRRKREG